MVTCDCELTVLGSILAVTELVTGFESCHMDMPVLFEPFIKEYIFKVNIS